MTAFEFFEHLPQPRTELEPLFSVGHDVVLVGTVLHDGQYRRNWSYMFPAIGGHVVFYSPTTMRYIADRWGYQVVATQQHTVFFRRPLTACDRRLLQRVLLSPSSRATRALLRLSPRYESLVVHDLHRLLHAFLASLPGTSPGESPTHHAWPAFKRQRWAREGAIRLAALMP